MSPVKADYIIYCSNSGYGGKTELDQAKVDMVVDCSDDMAKPLIAVFSAKTEEEKVKKWNQPVITTCLIGSDSHEFACYWDEQTKLSNDENRKVNHIIISIKYSLLGGFESQIPRRDCTWKYAETTKNSWAEQWGQWLVRWWWRKLHFLKIDFFSLLAFMRSNTSWCKAT